MLNNVRLWEEGKMPKFYHGTDGKAGFKFWASGTGIRRIPGCNLLPYLDDRTIGIHLKLEFTIKDKWKTGRLLLQSGNTKEFDEDNAEHIELFKVEPISKNIWKGDRIFKDGMPIQFPMGKHRIYLVLQNEATSPNIHHGEETVAVQIAWLNIVDGGDWLLNKTTQCVVAVIALAGLILSIIK
jgi:hypothetical protein